MTLFEESNIDLLLENGQMDQEKARVLLISCGYVLDPSCILPECKSFSDLIEFSKTLTKKYTKDEIYEGLVSLNGNETLITNEQLIKFLSAGNKLTQDEIEEFMDCLPISEGCFCLKDIVNEAYVWDDVKK